MSRVIKFRGICKTTNEWLFGSLQLYADGTCTIMYIEIDDKGYTSPVIPETVGQFTGLLDKNGVEIYEGDIVEFSTRRYHFGMDKGLQTIKFKSTVTFEDGCFMISEGKDYNDTYLCAFNEECLVVGNIYQSK